MGKSMTVRPSVRILVPGEWRTYRDLRLRALADSPDTFGRMLAEERDRLKKTGPVQSVNQRRSTAVLIVRGVRCSQKMGKV